MDLCQPWKPRKEIHHEISYVYGSTNVLNLACEVLWLQLVINNTVHYQNATARIYRIQISVL